MAAKYTLYYGNFRREVLQAEFMKAEMETRGLRVLETADAIAPEDTGAYRRRFRMRTTTRGGIHKDRAAAVIYNTDPAALSIEFGHTAPDGTRVSGHYTLTTAADAAGGH